MVKRDAEIEAQRELTRVIETGYITTFKHNKAIVILTVCIVTLTAFTIIFQIFPIHTYEVINREYVVRTNRFTGKAEYSYIGDELFYAEEKYLAELSKLDQQESKGEKKQKGGKGSE